MTVFEHVAYVLTYILSVLNHLVILCLFLAILNPANYIPKAGTTTFMFLWNLNKIHTS